MSLGTATAAVQTAEQGSRVVKGADLTAEEMALLGGSGEEETGPGDVSEEDELEPDPTGAASPADPNAIPEWVTLPEGIVLPKGRQLTFVRFRAAWTIRPEKGDRVCVLWPLTEADEKLALKRTRGEALRTIDELTKQIIRVIDGHKADWTGTRTAGTVNMFWDEIGPKCRQQLKNIYAKTHTLDLAETTDFFINCVAVRTVGG